MKDKHIKRGRGTEREREKERELGSKKNQREIEIERERERNIGRDGGGGGGGRKKTETVIRKERKRGRRRKNERVESIIQGKRWSRQYGRSLRIDRSPEVDLTRGVKQLDTVLGKANGTKGAKGPWWPIIKQFVDLIIHNLQAPLSGQCRMCSLESNRQLSRCVSSHLLISLN